jgi:hypothetical protein
VCLAASKSANLVFQVKKMLLLVRMNIFFCESVYEPCVPGRRYFSNWFFDDA